MGILKNETTFDQISLGTRCLVGRGPLAQLRLTSTTVSAEHAALYFLNGEWKVRDLGSRNGTLLNGVTLDPGSSAGLSTGDRLIFGSNGPVWVLEESLAPGPSARDPHGLRHAGSGGALWLPNDESPEAYIYASGPLWRLEQGKVDRNVKDGEELDILGSLWTLELPAATSMELTSLSQSTRADSGEMEYGLAFLVSRDEEHVDLSATFRGKKLSLGARAHNYPLLLLARRRLAEHERGVQENEAGWLQADDLREMLGIDREAMNLQLWRARQHFRKLGLPAEQLIERRADSGQLRLGIGVSSLSLSGATR